jgi:predicted PurR-regulated permease PerM
MKVMLVEDQKLSSIVKYLQVTVFTAAMLYFAKALFIPLLLGLLIAIIMYPISKRIEQTGISKPLAIAACLLIVAAIFGVLGVIFAWQLNTFSIDAPVILSKLQAAFQQAQQWLAKAFGVSLDLQHDWLNNLPASVAVVLKQTVQSTIDILFILFLTPVYTALFLYHRSLFVKCLEMVTPTEYRDQLHTILNQVVHTYFNYIKGMVLVYLVVGILNSAGLMLLGVKHAILFGMLCAIMTIIPYLGIIVSALLPISVVWIETGNVWYPLGVVAVFTFVQYLEANVIFPRVVGSQLHISTLAVLVAVIAGGILWGVAGMILFIPLVAIAKIMSEHIDEWKVLNVLLDRT